MRTTAPENKYLVIICVHDFKNKIFLYVFLYSITSNNSTEMGFFWKHFFFLAKISEINIHLGKDAHLEYRRKLIKSISYISRYKCDDIEYKEMLKILIVVKMFFIVNFSCAYTYLLHSTWILRANFSCCLSHLSC